ncbi:MAG: dihydrodipicolinate synthase family protein [Methylobacteriaceae bacterium]|nr:dihydrodipicolinate synthase family protein [Methylobacteriaceae bacterium]
MLNRPCHGLIAAPFLPMQADASIDWPALERYMDWLAGQKPAGIAMNMDASEVIALTEEEQEQVIRTCLGVLKGRVPFLSGIVAGSTRAAAAKAERYARMGVDGFPVFPPFPTFSGAPVPGEMIYRYHKAIADAARLPIICFQFPKGWGPDYTPEILRRVTEIPEVAAIKEASFDVAQTLSTIEVAAGLPRPIGVLTGSDTFIFEAMMMGCNGALIGFAGGFTAELVAMNEGVQGGDIANARAIWQKLGPIARFCWRPPIRDFRPRMKEVLRLQGLFPQAAVREPQLGVDEAERAEIRRLMLANGLLP